MKENLGMASNTPERPRTKRTRSSPTGKTPQQAEKRLVTRSFCTKRQLTYGSFHSRPEATTKTWRPASRLYIVWTDEEDKQLTNWVLFNSVGDVWPTHHNMKFWEGASNFLAATSGSRRTSKYMCLCHLIVVA